MSDTKKLNNTNGEFYYKVSSENIINDAMTIIMKHTNEDQRRIIADKLYRRSNKNREEV